MSFTPLSIPPFWGWTTYTPVIPKMYWDVYSQEERIKRLLKDHDKLVHYASYLAENIQTLDNQQVALSEQFDKFINGEYDEYYERVIAEWVDANLERIFTEFFNTDVTWFGLTDDGHFCAYIAENWDGIEFDTGMNYSDKNTYGRLILKTNYKTYVNNMGR